MTSPDDARVATRASVGEIRFDPAVTPATREAIREMFINRLAGYTACDLDRYLRDNTPDTDYIVNGRSYRAKTFRRVLGLFFIVQRIAALLGCPLRAEAVDAHVVKDGSLHITRCTLILTMRRRILRQSRLTMAIARQGGRWVWHEVTDDPIRRSQWRYATRPAANDRRSTHVDLVVPYASDERTQKKTGDRANANRGRTNTGPGEGGTRVVPSNDS